MVNVPLERQWKILVLPEYILLLYIYIPEYISISQGYQRARILIIYISQFMDPLKEK